VLSIREGGGGGFRGRLIVGFEFTLVTEEHKALAVRYLPLGFNLLSKSKLDRIESDEDIVFLRVSCQCILYQILNGPNLVDSVLGIGPNAFHNINWLSGSIDALVPCLENNFIKSIL
jgi:hypothetical protein